MHTPLKPVLFSELPAAGGRTCETIASKFGVNATMTDKPGINVHGLAQTSYYNRYR
jgi:hypothetical protein